MPAYVAVAPLFLALLLTAACGPSREEATPALRTAAPPPIPPAPPDPSAGEPKVVSRSISRAIWGVVPDAPRYKKDLRPSLIRGSAVAVSPTSLLTTCAAVDGRERVGIVRHNKYYMADVRPADPRGDTCWLEAPSAPLQPSSAPPRDFGDLRIGEPVYALVNESNTDLTLTTGRVTSGHHAGLPLTVQLPARVDGRSAVLFDARGSLLGFGMPPSSSDAVASLVPMPAALASLPRAAREPSPSATLPFGADTDVEEPVDPLELEVGPAT
jgi:hypothetical protein